MKAKHFIFILLTFCLTQSGLCQGTWSTDSTTGFTPVGYAASCVVGGKIYVIAGSTSPIFDENTNLVQIFDPGTHLWSAGPSYPMQQCDFTCSTLNGKIYVFGGVLGDSSSGVESNSLEIFDTSLKIWSEGPRLPASRGACTSSVVNGKIYLIGGTGNSSNLPLDSVDVFDPSNNTWSSAPPLPTAGSSLTSNVVNDKIYVMGGYPRSAAVYIFDPATNSWSQGPSMPTALSESASCVVDGKIYLMCGESNSNPLEIFNTETNTWINGPDMPAHLSFLMGVISQAANGKVYAIGGINSSGDGAPINFVFTPGASGVTVNSSPNSISGLRAFPNPASSVIQIMGEHSCIAHLFDLMGREVLSVAPTDGQVDVSHLEEGMYFLRIGSESAKIEIKR